MGLINVLLALFLILSSNIRLSVSRKNDNLESRSFIVLRTNTVNQKACTCNMPNICSCCENVKIFYTGDERRLCFNMAYQRSGLNFELAMDSTIIKSMMVANYKPLRLCSSLPGLLFSSICVNVLELNQFPKSISVCPRIEVTSKTERWQISYVCQSLSTETPSGISPLMGAASTPVQVMVMPGGMMPLMGQPPRVVIMGPMMPPVMTAAAATTPRPAAPPPAPAPAPAPQMPPTAQQMMPLAGVMLMGMRPAAPAAPAPAPAPAAMIPRPPAPAPAPAQPPAPMMPAAPAVQRPPGAAAPPAAAVTPPAVPPGAIVPRPANGLVYSLQPLFRNLADDPSDDLTAKEADVESTRLDLSIAAPDTDRLEQPSFNESDSDFSISNDQSQSDSTTQSTFDETTDDQVSTIEETTEPIAQSEDTESTRILNRKKRQYDIFDIFQQSNRCERAYRICITRSNNYIVSRLRSTRFNDNKNKNLNCQDKPARIVYGSGDNLCSYLTSTINNDFGSVSGSSQLNNSSSQLNDSLDAIIVHDDSDDDSDFYSQNAPQIAPFTPYNRPRIFPLRTPPLVTSQLQEQLKSITNDTLVISNIK